MRFAITDGKGFQITFDNGVLVSVQFGSTNYCENYYKYFLKDWHYGKEREERFWYSKNAEIAVLDTNANNKWITSDILKLAGLGQYSEDDVAGNIETDELVKVLNAAKNYHKHRKLKQFWLKYLAT